MNYRKYSVDFVKGVLDRFKDWKGLWTDFCKKEEMCHKLLKCMVKGEYFTDSKHHQKKRRTANCYYSGILPIGKNYGEKIKILKREINYKNVL